MNIHEEKFRNVFDFHSSACSHLNENGGNNRVLDISLKSTPNQFENKIIRRAACYANEALNVARQRGRHQMFHSFDDSTNEKLINALKLSSVR
jgi:putative heme iron utilization protein